MSFLVVMNILNSILIWTLEIVTYNWLGLKIVDGKYNPTETKN